MTEKEFNSLKKKVLVKLGTVYKTLAEMNSKSEGITESMLESIVNNAGLSMKELKLMGYEYDSDSMTFKKVKNVTFEDIEVQDQEEAKQEEVQIIQNRNNVPKMSHLAEEVDIAQFKDLMSNYEVLAEMIKLFKRNKAINSIDSKDNSIVIELPIERNKQFKFSYRVNDVVHEQFKEFCQQHKEFTSKDLLSMALKEYMDNHK